MKNKRRDAVFKKIILCSAVGFCVVLTSFTATFFIGIEIKKHQIITELQPIIDKRVQLFQNTLQKLQKKLSQDESIDVQDVYQKIKIYYKLLQPDNKYDGTDLFFLAHHNNTMVDQFGIRHNTHDTAIKQRELLVKNSDVIHVAQDNVYTMCRQVSGYKNFAGSICISGVLNNLIPRSFTRQYQTNFDFQLHLPDVQVSIRSKNVLSEYVKQLTQLLVLFFIIWLLFLWALLHSIRLVSVFHISALKKSKLKLNQLRLKNSMLDKKLLFTHHVVNQMKQKPSALLNCQQQIMHQDIDLVIDYFSDIATQKQAKINFELTVEAENHQCDVYLFQRLLASLLTESLYTLPLNGSIDIKFKLHEKMFIMMCYQDNNYAYDAAHVVDKLRRSPFFVDKPEFTDAVYSAQGKIEESHVKYGARKVKVILPVIILHSNIIQLSKDGALDESF